MIQQWSASMKRRLLYAHQRLKNKSLTDIACPLYTSLLHRTTVLG